MFVKATRLQNSIIGNKLVDNKVLSRGFFRLSIPVDRTNMLILGLLSISANYLYVVLVTIGSGLAVKLAKPIAEATEFI